MNIFEIDKQIEDILTNCIDEDGCIADESIKALEELQDQRDTKLENLACYIVNLTADAKAMREQEKILADRRKALEKKTERLKDYLQHCLNGEKLKDESRVSVSYRKSSHVEVDDDFVEWAMFAMPDFLTYKQPEPDKKVIGEFLKSCKLDNARIVETVSMTVK